MGMFMGSDGGNNLGQDYWNRDETDEQETLRYRFQGYSDKQIRDMRDGKGLYVFTMTDVEKEMVRRQIQ